MHMQEEGAVRDRRPLRRGLAVLALLALAALLAALRLLAAPAQAPDVLPPAAPVTAAPEALPPPAASAAELQAQQEAAARAAARAAPPPARVAARPDYVSETEWQVLQGLAARAPDPARELAHLVARLRFFKQLEQFRASAPPSPDLARALLAELPPRVAAADLAPETTRALLAELLVVLEPAPAARAARFEAEAATLRAGALEATPAAGDDR